MQNIHNLIQPTKQNETNNNLKNNKLLTNPLDPQEAAAMGFCVIDNFLYKAASLPAPTPLFQPVQPHDSACSRSTCSTGSSNKEIIRKHN